MYPTSILVHSKVHVATTTVHIEAARLYVLRRQSVPQNSFASILFDYTCMYVLCTVSSNTVMGCILHIHYSILDMIVIRVPFIPGKQFFTKSGMCMW